jgi:hypothetical protein
MRPIAETGSSTFLGSTNNVSGSLMLRSPQVKEDHHLKAKKTAAELEEMILDRCMRCDMEMLRGVKVSPSLLGWDATYAGRGTLVTSYGQQFDEIVRNFRAEFDLAE